jgi:iron complex transport system substrate-binding protein
MDGNFDVEQAVALKPDAVLMNVDATTAGEEAGHIEKLPVGSSTLHIDFRERPKGNTVSTRICSDQALLA